MRRTQVAADHASSDRPRVLRAPTSCNSLCPVEYGNPQGGMPLVPPALCAPRPVWLFGGRRAGAQRPRMADAERAEGGNPALPTASREDSRILQRSVVLRTTRTARLPSGRSTDSRSAPASQASRSATEKRIRRNPRRLRYGIRPVRVRSWIDLREVRYRAATSSTVRKRFNRNPPALLHSLAVFSVSPNTR